MKRITAMLLACLLLLTGCLKQAQTPRETAAVPVSQPVQPTQPAGTVLTVQLLPWLI